MQAFNDILKTQMVLQMGGNNGNPLLNILALNTFDLAVKLYPSWLPSVKAFCCRRQKPGNPAMPSPLKSVRASIEFERSMPQNNNRNTNTSYTTRMDAVISYVSNKPEMKTLLCVTQHDYLPHEFEPVGIEHDIYFELQDMKTNEGQLEIIKFKLFCYEHDVQHLQAFVDTCNVDYERRMSNKLGAHRYYFDQMIHTKVKGSLQNPLPTSHLMYTKTKFTTNRNFDNVFFEERNQVRTRTKFFLEHKDWYDKKGIPYTLGFMFHGPPGCGKTSTVKAIANEGRRHIINVQLSEIKTKQQLQHLFFNDEIHVYNGTNTERYTIPVSERLYVIEDIDAMGDTVLRREWKKPEMPKQKKSEDPMFGGGEKEEEKESLDLAFLLNLLDGTLEANGRILIITTNFPERIDRALIRPGRVDMIINFKKCNQAVLQDMVNSFYEKEILVEGADLDYKWSPAEVNQILFRNFDDPAHAVAELVGLMPHKLYGFVENESSDLVTIPTGIENEY